MDEIEKISIEDLANELEIKFAVLSHAVKKVADWFDIKGTSHKQIKVKKEALQIKNRKNLPGSITLSKPLAEIVRSEFKEKDDYISLLSLSKENNLPYMQLKQFVHREKEENLVDFLGMNIFLNSKYYYIPLRRKLDVLRSFFIYLLNNHSSSQAIEGSLINTDNDKKDTFNILEEIIVDRTKQGRILGFFKNADRENAAIVGFYDGTLKLETHVRRLISTDKRPWFKKYDSRTMQPVSLRFSLNDILSRENREKFNVLVEYLRNSPVKVWGGGNDRSND